MEYLQYLDKLLDIVVVQEASDLDISVGHVPNIRITGQLVPLSQEKIILPKDSEGIAFSLMSEIQPLQFASHKLATTSLIGCRFSIASRTALAISALRSINDWLSIALTFTVICGE